MPDPTPLPDVCTDRACYAFGIHHWGPHRRPQRLGWWVISGENLLAMLRRAHDGEDPNLLYTEEYANSSHEEVPGVT